MDSRRRVQDNNRAELGRPAWCRGCGRTHSNIILLVNFQMSITLVSVASNLLGASDRWLWKGLNRIHDLHMIQWIVSASSLPQCRNGSALFWYYRCLLCRPAKLSEVLSAHLCNSFDVACNGCFGCILHVLSSDNHLVSVGRRNVGGGHMTHKIGLLKFTWKI